MKKCKSIWRAIRRGHPVNLFYFCYESRKETSRIRRRNLKALENAGK